MSILREIDTKNGVVFVVWHGVVLWKEWQEHARGIVVDPQWIAASRFLVDLRTVTSTASIGPQEIEQASRLFSRHRDALANKRGAVIAGAEFTNASRFESLIANTGISMVVFNTLDTACIFLGLDQRDANSRLENLRARLREKS